MRKNVEVAENYLYDEAWAVFTIMDSQANALCKVGNSTDGALFDLTNLPTRISRALKLYNPLWKISSKQIVADIMDLIKFHFIQVSKGDDGKMYWRTNINWTEDCCTAEELESMAKLKAKNNSSN